MPTKQTMHDYHRQQLETWLETYRLDRALRETHTQDRITDAGDRLPDNQAPAPMPGQIRLLPPACGATPQIERPVYACLLPGDRPDCMTVIPFSRFSIPATPQEWKTGLRQGPLQVLCLWNAHTCKADALRTSWHVGTIPDKKRQEIDNHLQQPNPPGDWSSRRFGPPLLHPLDPRQLYLQEERMLMQELLAAMVKTPSNTIYYRIPEPDTQLLRAAESPDTGEGTHAGSGAKPNG